MWEYFVLKNEKKLFYSDFFIWIIVKSDKCDEKSKKVEVNFQINSEVYFLFFFSFPARSFGK